MIARVPATLLVRKGEVIVPAWRFSVGPVEERILWALGAQQRLADARDPLCHMPIHRDDLIQSCYGDDPEGGPDGAEKSITVHICKLNRVLREVGWRISNVGDKRWVLHQEGAP